MIKTVQNQQSTKPCTDQQQPSDHTKYLYDKIESIKSTICMANCDRPELWIQRQNLQDLYNQIILNDIDFTIDKKLEQDLWNYVFKTQINYFQSQIKDGSSSGGGQSSSQTSHSQTSTSSNSSLSQKRLEAQASLTFFLEAARGFYTKLLHDIVLKYDSLALTYLPFCKKIPSVFDKINTRTDRSSKNEATPGSTKEKQILYICQHILTHLGDISRYSNSFTQAKNYYLHAIKLVPYLGHPYNQLGILFETSRINQLSTVFYYIRSISLKYTFPLAATNLENFFLKLIDVPLNKYNPGNLSISTLKLAHKDLISLFLQAISMIYSLHKTNGLNGKHLNSNTINKLPAYLDLFKSCFNQFLIQTPSVQREKLDSNQLCQIVSIVLFCLNLNPSKSGNGSNEQALNLFVYMIEQFIEFYGKSLEEDNLESVKLVLPALYLSFNYIETYKEAYLIKSNELWLKQTNKKDDKSKNYVDKTVKMLNSIVDTFKSEVSSDSEWCPLKYTDYPLCEDRMLDSFLPFKQVHEQMQLAFRKHVYLLNEKQESVLRAQRIIKCMRRILTAKSEDACYVTQNSNDCPDHSVKFGINAILVDKPSPTVQKSPLPLVSNQSPANTTVTPRRRKNVALSSITEQQQQSKQEPEQTNPPQNNVLNNILTNQLKSSSSSPSPLTFSSNSSSSSGSFIENLNPTLPTKNLISNSFTNTNALINNIPPLINNQTQFQQGSFFPSASIRKFPTIDQDKPIGLPLNPNINSGIYDMNQQQKQLQMTGQQTVSNNPSSSSNNLLSNNGFPTFLPNEISSLNNLSSVNNNHKLNAQFLTGANNNNNNNIDIKDQIETLNNKFKLREIQQQQNPNQYFQNNMMNQIDEFKSLQLNNRPINNDASTGSIPLLNYPQLANLNTDNSSILNNANWMNLNKFENSPNHWSLPVAQANLNSNINQDAQLLNNLLIQQLFSNNQNNIRSQNLDTDNSNLASSIWSFTSSKNNDNSTNNTNNNNL